MTSSREIRLKRRPAGMPVHDDFELVNVELTAPCAGQVQVRNKWMSVDPYMRGRMNAQKSYIAPFALGEALSGGAIGEVTISNDPALRPGDLVSSMFGWRESFNVAASEVRKLETNGLPPQTFLGAAGVVGLTAYTGLMRIAALKEGETVFVSAAAGAVGSLACQIAKIKGCVVIGSAGGAAKLDFLNEIGVDHAIDYKAEKDLAAALVRAAPNGIDVYFENVGGAHLDAALLAANNFARFAVCGLIADYNSVQVAAAPTHLFQIVAKSIRMEGFIVANHFDLMKQYLGEFRAWHAAGRIRWRETVVPGLDNAVDAFLQLFRGSNIGKMLVKLD